MQIINGKYASATVFTDNIEDTAKDQIKELCDQVFVKGASVKIMPDVHSGKGCVIGFTADLGDKVIPNLIGVDISCGMLTVNLGTDEIDLEFLDVMIDIGIPSGFNIHAIKHAEFDRLNDLRCYDYLRNVKRIENSIGTLGGGNHFIEVGQAPDKTNYLIIHSGSRNLGKQVAEFYQKMAIDACKSPSTIKQDIQKIIDLNKTAGTPHLIQEQIAKLKKAHDDRQAQYPDHLCYLEGSDRDDYLHDMAICQEYASLNRLTMANSILPHIVGAELEELKHFETLHNYIDLESNIIRKGAISAKAGELVLIPINMRDGSILARGKGNPNWNYSAPHGAGRIMSRGVARRELNIEDYKAEMKDVWSSSVKESTLDEAPMAYKPMQEIIDNITDTVKIIDILKPIYNFKAN